MHRFYLPPAECKADTLVLHDKEAHHALHVLRLREAEAVVVLDGAGQEIHCALDSHDRNSVQLRVVERRHGTPRRHEITLLQAVPKGKIIEEIIEKATELGASRIVPLLSERVVTRLDSAAAEAKAAKWQAVAIEAIKQCGNLWLPKVEVPMAPEKFLARNETFELPLVACLESDSRHPRHWFEQFAVQHGRQPSTISCWIGPEGDFSPEEYRRLKEVARPITLGPLILRTDTAAAYCLSVLSYELRAGA
jgi:16S rRNA (uracil1498-N3)-methyltransferase